MIDVYQILLHQLSDNVRSAADPDILSFFLFQFLHQIAGRPVREQNRGFCGFFPLFCRSVCDHPGGESLVNPFSGGQLRGYLMIGIPAHDHRVHRFDKVLIGIPVFCGFLLAVHPAHSAVGICDVSVQAHTDV